MSIRFFGGIPCSPACGTDTAAGDAEMSGGRRSLTAGAFPRLAGKVPGEHVLRFRRDRVQMPDFP
ncbi:hypothetical protein CXU01_06030 [Akkermansia muciniphila]|nr:hypothetical protein CXU01_06030 [Akkermansia muciniphila]